MPGFSRWFVVCGQQVAQWLRPMDAETLRIVGAKLMHERQGIFIFNLLGHNLQVQRVRDVDHGADERPVRRVSEDRAQ